MSENPGPTAWAALAHFTRDLVSSCIIAVAQPTQDIKYLLVALSGFKPFKFIGSLYSICLVLLILVHGRLAFDELLVPLQSIEGMLKSRPEIFPGRLEELFPG